MTISFRQRGLQLARLVDRRARSEIVELEQLTKLDLPFRSRTVRRRGALGPLDGLFPRLDLDQPVAGNQPGGLGKRPVHDGRFSSRRELDARALRARLQSSEIE